MVKLKKCNICGKGKTLNMFYRSKINTSGLNDVCIECYKKRCQNYRKTKDGIITSIYGHQVYRSVKKSIFYKPTYSKKEFSEWVLSQDKFHTLYEEWINSNYATELKPSVDRIDDYVGYVFDNLQILTWEENNKKGLSDRQKKINTKTSKPVVQYDLNNNVVRKYSSMTEASIYTNVPQGAISNACCGKSNTSGGFKWKFKN